MAATFIVCAEILLFLEMFFPTATGLKYMDQNDGELVLILVRNGKFVTTENRWCKEGRMYYPEELEPKTTSQDTGMLLSYDKSINVH